MIYTPLTVKAINIAYNAHKGQLDKCGVPYIFHPYHLAEQMDDEISVCTALLHDVIEDTSVTFEELEKDFPECVTSALKLLTHNDNTPYLEYVERMKENPLAVKVKLADLHHNLDETRLMLMPAELAEKAKLKREKYLKALEILNN